MLPHGAEQVALYVLSFVLSDTFVTGMISNHCNELGFALHELLCKHSPQGSFMISLQKNKAYIRTIWTNVHKYIYKKKKI